MSPREPLDRASIPSSPPRWFFMCFSCLLPLRLGRRALSQLLSSDTNAASPLPPGLLGEHFPERQDRNQGLI